MAESSRNWTIPQKDAIFARGGQLLVSAAAGSGKTAVLVERAVGLICDPENPVDADRLLVVTFSRAAAAEMRQRMGARLSAMLRENPADLRLQRQQALLAGAQISTVDSFCLDLVRQNFQNLEISPDFSIADPGELSILEADCVRETIEELYGGDAGGNATFLELVELLSTARDDSRLAEVILQIYNFSRSHPFFEEWLAEKLAMYGGDIPVAETVWGASILRHARDSLRYCAELTRKCLRIAAGDEQMEKAYGGPLRTDLSQLERCLELAKAKDWDATVNALSNFVFERLGGLKGDGPDKQRVQDARAQVRKAVQDLAGKYLNATASEFHDDLYDLRPKISVLFDAVNNFTVKLYKCKLEKKRLDFADLEHLALRLLVERTPDGYRPSAQADEIAARYDYVMVDEYQDTNEVQDMIFSCVSRGQTNLFMVGDVKQSIYSFRQAMPEIFMKKKEVFFPYRAGVGAYPAKIILDTNFRSRVQVTDAVNAVFSLIMSGEMGEVDYGEEEALRCGASYRPYEGAEPELLLWGVAGYGGGRDSTAIEAGQIARKIRAMLDKGYRVEDGGEPRPATLRDFCILLRSPRGRAETYVKELARHGIAAGAENAGGYLATREVSSVVSLLRALDNPLLDVELVAALLSPLFGFTPDDVARVRLDGKGLPFFSALHKAADGDEPEMAETRRRCAEFLAMFTRLRAEAAILPADRLLMRVYDETDALAVFQAMGMGASRKANLLLLIEYAADYHAIGYKQLGGLVAFLGRLEERQGDLAPAGNAGEGADIVRIMSIHRSKGLEFPIVFLADTARQFNKVDLRQNTLLHSRFGFACVRRDHQTRGQYPTIPMQAIRLEAQRSILSEEMRILYVAMTRAREKLIVTAAVKADLGKKLNNLASELQGGKLPPYVVGGGNCYADWILMALLHHPSCDALRELARVDDLGLIEDGNPWRVEAQEIISDDEPKEAGSQKSEPKEPDPKLLALLEERAAWQYSYREQTEIPAKLSVSDAAKGERSVQYRFTARPSFLSAGGLTPTERGNAMHKFMQFADYQKAWADLESEITRMRSARYLSPAETDSLNRQRLRDFFESPLATRIFSSQKVYRELKFMAECGQDMLGNAVGDLHGSKIVLQGVADCVFVEEDGAVIVDYKTDAVSDPMELRDRYAAQLKLYRAILSDTLGAPVKECIVYSFHLSLEVPV